MVDGQATRRSATGPMNAETARAPMVAEAIANLRLIRDRLEKVSAEIAARHETLLGPPPEPLRAPADKEAPWQSQQDELEGLARHVFERLLVLETCTESLLRQL